MAEVKFNKNYKDLELDKLVKAGEPVEMTVKRADEIVSKVKAQSDRFKGYEDFAYERLDKADDKTDGKTDDKTDGKTDDKTDKKKDEEGK